MHLYKVSDFIYSSGASPSAYPWYRVVLPTSPWSQYKSSLTLEIRVAILAMGPQSQTEAVAAALVMRAKKPLGDSKAGEEISWTDPSLFSRPNFRRWEQKSCCYMPQNERQQRSYLKLHIYWPKEIICSVICKGTRKDDTNFSLHCSLFWHLTLTANTLCDTAPSWLSSPICPVPSLAKIHLFSQTLNTTFHAKQFANLLLSWHSYVFKLPLLSLS